MMPNFQFRNRDEFRRTALVWLAAAVVVEIGVKALHTALEIVLFLQLYRVEGDIFYILKERSMESVHVLPLIVQTFIPPTPPLVVWVVVLIEYALVIAVVTLSWKRITTVKDDSRGIETSTGSKRIEFKAGGRTWEGSPEEFKALRERLNEVEFRD